MEKSQSRNTTTVSIPKRWKDAIDDFLKYQERNKIPRSSQSGVTETGLRYFFETNEIGKAFIAEMGYESLLNPEEE